MIDIDKVIRTAKYDGARCDYLCDIALAQILKDVRFPADKYDLIKSIEDLGTSEGLDVLPIIQGIEERQYQNVAEVASAAGLAN
jgi:hypothetical protein